MLTASATLVLMLLAMAAYVGAAAAEVRDDDASSETELQELAIPNHAGHAAVPMAAVAGGVAAAAGAAGSRASGPSVSADGEIVTVGSRVQTQHSAAYGGDGSWYAGTVLTLHPDGRAGIIYDDGEEWTAKLDEVYVLQGDDLENQSGAGHAALQTEPLTPVAPPDRSR